MRALHEAFELDNAPEAIVPKGAIAKLFIGRQSKICYTAYPALQDWLIRGSASRKRASGPLARVLG